MEQSRNIDFNSELEVNSIRDTIWRLTTRVYILEDFITEQFGQILGPDGFSKAPSNVSSPSKPDHSASRKRNTITTSTNNDNGPSTSFSARKEKNITVSPKTQIGNNDIVQNTKKKKTGRSESMSTLNPANIDIDSYDIDHSETNENGVMILVAKKKPGDAVPPNKNEQNESLEEEDDAMESTFDDDYVEEADSDCDSQEVNQSEINENDFIVYVPKDDSQRRNKKSDINEFESQENELRKVSIKQEPDVICSDDESEIPKKRNRKAPTRYAGGELSTVSDNSVNEGNNSVKRNRRGGSQKWSLAETFEDEKVAKEYLLFTEWELRVDFTKTFPGGKKVFYKCQTRCPAKAYLMMLNGETEVALYTNNVAHSEHEKSRGISKMVKLRIRKLYEENLRHDEILKALEEEKLTVPDPKQLRRFLNYLRVKKYERITVTEGDNTIHQIDDIKLQISNSNILNQGVEYQVVEEVQILPDHIVYIDSK